MMTTRQKKAMSSASSELLAPSRTNTATQTELQSEHATTQASGCRLCLGLLPEVEGNSKCTYGRYAQVEELLCLVAEFQEEVGRLRSV